MIVNVPFSRFWRTAYMIYMTLYDCIFPIDGCSKKGHLPTPKNSPNLGCRRFISSHSPQFSMAFQRWKTHIPSDPFSIFLVGGWAVPLKNHGVKVSWDHEIPNGKMKILPNHQPAYLHISVCPWLQLKLFSPCRRQHRTLGKWGWFELLKGKALTYLSAAVSAVTLIAVWSFFPMESIGQTSYAHLSCFNHIQ